MVTDDGPCFSVEPVRLFGRAAPLEVELGAGRGDFVIARAAEFPDHNFLAIELANSIARLLATRAGRRGLKNLRVIRMDARTLVNLMLPVRSVDAYHIYFPDPWPKARHAKHRLFTPGFLAAIARTLSPGGQLYVASDVGDYAGAIFAMAAAAGLRRLEIAVPGAVGSGFAQKFIAAGRAIHAAAFVAGG
jgi:tRNA (guanine-N7-)-methyltransferase